jgi:hypothetical protein
MKFVMGTSEYLVVDVTETLGEITELVGATFDIFDADYVDKVVDTSNDVIIDGMKVKCLIHPVEGWGGRNDYDLFLNLTGLPSAEVPRLGPIRFTVEGYA